MKRAFYDPHGRAVSPTDIRRAWSAVTRTPCATLRELAPILGMSIGQVSAALHILRTAGYIAFADKAARAREIIVPFVELSG